MASLPPVFTGVEIEYTEPLIAGESFVLRVTAVDGRYAALLTSEGAQVIELSGANVYVLRADESSPLTYTSAYTAAQIDEFLTEVVG